MTKEQWSRVIGVVLTAVIALLGVWGYDVIVDQPREAQVIEAALEGGGGGFGVQGTYNTPCYFDQGGAQFTMGPGCSMVLEGATEDAYQTTFAVTDPTADRTVTIPNVSGTVLLTNTPGVIVLGNNVVTGTLTINHGLTTPQTAFCTIGADSTAAGAGCTATVVTSTVTIETWKADGATPGDAGLLVHWMVGGQP